jgi:mono/diheme cytochrome c family protein
LAPITNVTPRPVPEGLRHEIGGPPFKNSWERITGSVVTLLAATVVRSAQDDAIQKVFSWIADSGRPQWLRTALLSGAQVALLGAQPVPAAALQTAGTARGGALPCPTCPGGRAGPGGAYAFPRPPAPATSTPRGGPRLRLTREPTAFAQLALAGGEFGRRAADVLTRVAWPGKPGEASIPALSSTEQQRFDSGRDIYRNSCQACHQADGRGQDRVAPTLIDSALTLGPAEITARILLHGKEGPIGLMPPIGVAITDEQIASVLTYVRREWGQTGTPVSPQTITHVRALTAGRTRPWTHDELMALTTASGLK